MMSGGRSAESFPGGRDNTHHHEEEDEKGPCTTYMTTTRITTQDPQKRMNK